MFFKWLKLALRVFATKTYHQILKVKSVYYPMQASIIVITNIITLTLPIFHVFLGLILGGGGGGGGFRHGVYYIEM